MNIAVLAITRGAQHLGQRLAAELGADFYPCKGRLRATISEAWQDYDGIICIMAAGIVVRAVAPLLTDKHQDPAVVVCDECGAFAISLLSGHLGGANSLAERVARITAGQPVLTTASDVLGKTALDLWCRDLNLQIANKRDFTEKMGKLVDSGSLTLYSEYPLPSLPADLIAVDRPQDADLVITKYAEVNTTAALLHPKALVIGIGCKRGTPAAVIRGCVEATCQAHNLALASVAALASITLKQDEEGLLAYAAEEQLQLHFFSSNALNTVPGRASSPTVLKVTGAKAVAEPAAMLGAGTDTLLVSKSKWQGATTAVAEKTDPLIND